MLKVLPVLYRWHLAIKPHTLIRAARRYMCGIKSRVYVRIPKPLIPKVLERMLIHVLPQTLPDIIWMDSVIIDVSIPLLWK